MLMLSCPCPVAAMPLTYASINPLTAHAPMLPVALKVVLMYDEFELTVQGLLLCLAAPADKALAVRDLVP